MMIMKSIKKPDNHQNYFFNMMLHHHKGTTFNGMIQIAADYIRDAYMMPPSSRHIVTNEVVHWKRVLYCAHHVDLG